MRLTRHHGRRAISPVLATVILIAITLVAATAIAGFVFGLMGTFTSTAQVSAGVVACSGTPEVCTLTLRNSGSADVAITGTCTMAFLGGNYLSAAGIVTGNLHGGNSATVTCTTPGFLHAVPDTQIVGSVALGNGAEVLFAGSAQ
ncbi:MAG: type IV pilin N-terminal domain-containing protein [Thaumarchaeota archaeon]|nr:type IV pilin N-terminal domain-containing protein [Nitrososphaerota archaeon]